MGAPHQALLMGGGDSHVFVNFTQALNPSGTVLSSTSAAMNVTTGHHLFVFVGYTFTATTATVTDTAGNTYTALTQRVTANGFAIGQWFYSLNVTGNAANVVTVTLAVAKGQFSIAVFDFSRATLPVLDVEAYGVVDSGTSVSSAAFSTTAPGLVLVGTNVLITNQSGVTIDGGVTHMTSPAITGNALQMGYLLTSSTLSSQVITASSTPTDSGRVICIAAFK